MKPIKITSVWVALKKTIIKAEISILEALFPSIFKKRRHIRDYFTLAKNGTITGAADNDPAGIVTYTQVGSAVGYSLLWLLVLATPLLIAVEEMSAKVAVVSKKSLSYLLRKQYGKRVAFIIISMAAFCNLVTIGADIAGMGAVLGLLFKGPQVFFSILITLFIAIVLIRGTYTTISRYFFLLTPVFLCYIAVVVITKPEISEIIKGTLNPFAEGGLNYWVLAAALLGTTISPYLIFWQNTEEIEEKKDIRQLKDERLGVRLGMLYSNLIAYFVIIAGATVLFKAGIVLNTARDAALALRPFAGENAFYLFSLGLLGSGLLAIPILASSTAYIFSDLFHWKEGLDKKIWQARGFYGVLIGSLFFGLLFILLGLNPIKMLVYSQVLNAFLIPFLIYYLIKLSNDKAVVGVHKNSKMINLLGWVSFLIFVLVDSFIIYEGLR